MYVCRMLRMQSERYYRCSRIRVCPSLARLGWLMLWVRCGRSTLAITNRYFDPKYWNSVAKFPPNLIYFELPTILHLERSILYILLQFPWQPYARSSRCKQPTPWKVFLYFTCTNFIVECTVFLLIPDNG